MRRVLSKCKGIANYIPQAGDNISIHLKWRLETEN
jgi:hypothetical protein